MSDIHYRPEEYEAMGWRHYCGVKSVDASEPTIPKVTCRKCIRMLLSQCASDVQACASRLGELDQEKES